MKTIFTFALLFVAFNSIGQVDFIKYFDGKKIEIETFEEEKGKFFINDKKIDFADVSILSYNDDFKVNVYKIDRDEIRDIRNLKTNYLFADRKIKGKVNLYEYKLNTGERQFFNVGDEGEIKIATFKNLKPILSSNSTSYKYLKSGRNGIVIKKIIYTIGFSGALVGLGYLAYEAARGGNDFKNGAILFGAGFSIFAITRFIKTDKRNKKLVRKAIEAYK